MASTFKFLDRNSSENETSKNDRAQLIMQLAQQQMRQQRNNQRAFALLLEKAAPSQRTTGGTDGMGKDKKAVQEPVKAKREQEQWDLDVIQEFVINDMQWGQPSKRQMKKMSRKVKAMDLSIEDLILPPVPANDSPETYAELLEIQEMAMLRDSREKDIAAQARKDGIIAVFKDYSDEHGLQTNWDFVRMVLDDVQTICLNLKFTYNRVRPSTLAQHLEVILSPQGGFDKIDSPSYPSFHSTAGRVLAEVISGAYAGHREKLMRIGDTIGMNRVIGGYHFLTDHQAGQTLGSHLVLRIPQNLSINPVYETEQTVDGRTAEAVAANFMDALEQRHRTMAVNKEENAEDNYVEGIRAAMATHSRETSHMTDILKSKEYPHAFDEKGLEFLNNYEPVEVGGWKWNKDTKEWESDGETYPSVEHAYQASGFNDPKIRDEIRKAKFAGVGGKKGQPLGAKGLARKYAAKWDTTIGKRDGSSGSPILQLMEKLVTEKFNNPALRKKLEATHATHAEIEEANTHFDDFWGTVGTDGKAGKGGKGQNHLGKILTKVRGGTPQVDVKDRKVTVHSGGAEGSDDAWAQAFPDDVIGHSYKDHWQIKNTTGRKIWPDDHLLSAEHQGKYADASKWLGKNVVSNPKYKRNTELLMGRNWEQVKNSDAVIGIIEGFSKKGDRNYFAGIGGAGNSPHGGTAYAVAMGIQKGIPVHVYNLETDNWLTWNPDSNTWDDTALDEIPHYKNFAGVGTRGEEQTDRSHILQENAKAAIQAYSGKIKTFQKEKPFKPFFTPSGTPQGDTPKQHMFVFGSNLDGRNGKGAALHAQKFGASNKGVRGADLDRVEGNTYSLPTKLRAGYSNNDIMPLTEMGHHFENFARYVLAHPEIEFHIPNLGMQNGGYGSDQGQKSLAAKFSNAFKEVFQAADPNFKSGDLKGRLHFDKGVEKDGKVGTGLGDFAFGGQFKDTSATYAMPDSAKLPSRPTIGDNRRSIESTLEPKYRDGNKIKSGALDTTSSAIPEDSDGNTFSASNDQFLAQLTHANVIANSKFKKDIWPKQGTGRELPVTYKDITYSDAEKAYHELIRVKDIEGTSKEAHDIMVGVNKAKFAAYPDLVTTLSDRGGLTYLKTLKHDVPTSGGGKKWEGEGVEALFLRVIAEAYADADGVTAENKKGLSDFREGESIWGNYTIGDNGRSLTDKSQGTEPMYYAYDDKRPARNDVLHSTGGTYNAILTGDRTSTTRQNWNYKEGAIVSIKYNNASTDSFDVRITSVDATRGIDPDVWSKSEGYKPSEHSRYTGSQWKTYTFEPIEDERFKAEVDKFHKSDQGNTYNSVTGEVSRDGNIYADPEVGFDENAGEEETLRESEYDQRRGVVNEDPREAWGNEQFDAGTEAPGKYDDDGIDYEDEAPDGEFIEGDRSVVMHSGLAEGSDTLWDEARTDKTSQKLAGHSFEGHAWKYKGKDRVHHEQEALEGNRGKYKDAIAWLMERGSRSKEIIPEDKTGADAKRTAEFKLNLQMRNYEQVRNSDAVIAVVKEFRNKAPVGGSGVAVAMGIQKGIPVHVFDEKNERWVTYDESGDAWFETTQPPFYKNFAAIGSREVKEDSIGHDAIKSYMAALGEFQGTEEPFGGEVERTTNRPVRPDHLKGEKPDFEPANRGDMSEEERIKDEMGDRQQPPEWNASIDEDTLKSIRARKLGEVREFDDEVLEAEKLLDEARKTLSNADEGDREDAVYWANIRRQKHDEAVELRNEAQRSAATALDDIKAFRKQPKKAKPTKAEKAEEAKKKKLADNPMNSAEARKITPREFNHTKPLDVLDKDGKPFESANMGLGGGMDVTELQDDGTEFSPTTGMNMLKSILHGDSEYSRPPMPDSKTLTGADLAVLYSEYGNEDNKDLHFGVKEVLEDYFEKHIATSRLGKDNILSQISGWITDWEEGNYLEFVNWIGENYSPEGDPAYRRNRGEAVSSRNEIFHMMGEDKANYDEIERESSSAANTRTKTASDKELRAAWKNTWLKMSVAQRLERSERWLDSNADTFAAFPLTNAGTKLFLKDVGMYTVGSEFEEYTPVKNPNPDLNYALLKRTLGTGWKPTNGLRKEFGFPHTEQEKDKNGKPKYTQKELDRLNHVSLDDFMGMSGALDMLIDNPSKFLNTGAHWTNPSALRKIAELKRHRDGLSGEDRAWWDSLGNEKQGRRTDVFKGRRTEWFKQAFLNSNGIEGAKAQIAVMSRHMRDDKNPLKADNRSSEAIADGYWREALADVNKERRRASFDGLAERESSLDENGKPLMYEDGTPNTKRISSFFGSKKSAFENAEDVEAALEKAMDDKFSDLDYYRSLIRGAGFRDKIAQHLESYREMKAILDARLDLPDDHQAMEMSLQEEYAALADMGNYELRAAYHILQHDASTTIHVSGEDATIAALDSIPSQYRLFSGADERNDYLKAYRNASPMGKQTIRDKIATGEVVDSSKFLASVENHFSPVYDHMYNDRAKAAAETAGMRFGTLLHDRQYKPNEDVAINQDDLSETNDLLESLNFDLDAAEKTDSVENENKDRDIAELKADIKEANRVRDGILASEDAIASSSLGSDQYDSLTINKRAPDADAQNAVLREYFEFDNIMENLIRPAPYRKDDEGNPENPRALEQWHEQRRKFFELLVGIDEDKRTTFLTDLIEAYESGNPPVGYSAVRNFENLHDPNGGKVIDVELEERADQMVKDKGHGFQMGALQNLIKGALIAVGKRKFNPETKKWEAGQVTSHLWDRIFDAQLIADTEGDYEAQYSRSTEIAVERQRGEMEATMRKHAAAQSLPDFEDNLSSELDRYTQLRSEDGVWEGPKHSGSYSSMGKLIKNGKKKDGSKYNSVDDVINGELTRKHEAYTKANPEQQPSQAQPQPSGQPIDQQPTTEA